MEGVNLGFQHPDTAKATSLKAPLLQRLNPFRKAPEKAKPEPTPDVVFARREFIEETGTMNKKEVRFDESMQLQYQTYLENHLTQLIKLKPTSPLFSSEKYRHHKALMERLCSGDEKSGFTLDSKKIAKGLKEDPDLWIVATQMMEEDIALTTWGLGQIARFNKGKFNGAKGVFSATPKTGHTHLNVDRGVLNQLVHSDKFQKIMGHAAVIGGDAGIGAGIAAYLGAVPVVGAIVGGGIPAAITGGRLALISLLKDGVTIKTNTQVDLLQVMQSPEFAGEAAYLDEVLGLGVHDFQVVANKIQRSVELPTSVEIAKIQEDLLTKMITRFNFLTNKKGLNIPANRVNMIPDNIYFDAGHHMGVFTTWEKEMQDMRNKRNEQFIIDNGGKYPTRLEKVKIEQEARQETITRRLEKSLAKDLDENHKTVQMLTERETAYAKGEGTVEHGRGILKLTKELKEEKEAIEAIDGVLTTEQATLTTFAEKQESFRKAQEDAEKAFGTSELKELRKILKYRNGCNDTELERIYNGLRDAEIELTNAEKHGAYIDSKTASAKSFVTQLTLIDTALIVANLPTVGLTRADLANLPTQEIFTRVNKAHNLLAVGGHPLAGCWDSKLNTNLALREQLLFAIAEARAAESEIAVSAPSVDYALWIGPPPVGFSVGEHFLRTATVETVATELHRRGALPAPPFTPADRARIEAVIGEVGRAFGARMQKLNEVLTQEHSQKEQYNFHIASERDAIDRLLGTTKTHQTELLQLETTENELRSGLGQTVRNYLENNLSEHTDALGFIAMIHTDATGRTGYDGELDPANLHLKTLQQIMDGIHIAHGAGSALAWDATADADRDKVRIVISARSEKEAQIDLGRDTDLAAMTELKRFGITEKEIRTLSRADLIARATGWTDDPATRTYVQTAMDQAKKRFEIRTNRTHRNLSDALSEAALGHIPAFTNADLAYLEKDSNYRNVASAIARKISVLQRVHPALARVRDSTDVLSFVTALDAQRRALVDLGDMSGGITAIRQEVEPYMTALKSCISAREEAKTRVNGAQTLAELETEKKTREDHPDAELTTMISSLETAKESLKTTSAEAVAAKKITDEISNSFITVIDIDAQLTAVGLSAVGLDTVALSTLSYPEICRRINAAYDAGAAHTPPLAPPVGWPKERNGEEKYQNMVARAIAGAGAGIRKDNLFFGLTQIEQADYFDVSSLFEDYEMYSLSPSELIAEATHRGAVHIPPIVHSMDQARAQAMLDLYAKFYQTHGDAEKDLQDRNATRIRDISYESAHIAESFDDRREFIKRTKEMAKSQGKIYGRIPGFMQRVVNDPDFDRPIDPANPAFSATEKAPTPRGAVGPIANVPKGYYDILNFMFDYYDTTDPSTSRGETFQKLLNVEHFRPDRIAVSLADELNLSWYFTTSPPYTIQEVCVALQYQIRIGRITSSDMYQAVKGMMDSYISEIKPM